MKYFYKLFITTGLLLAVASCEKQEVSRPTETKHNYVRVCVDAEKDVPTEGSKITLNTSHAFGFENGDKIRLLVGQYADGDASVTKQMHVEVPMVDNVPGRFEGTIDLEEYDISDIREAVLVRNETPADAYSLVVNSNIRGVGYMF